MKMFTGDTWRIELPDDCSGPTILTDHFGATNAYPIITKIIVRPPLVIRAAFHDYLCEDYRASTAYFSPIVDSLVLV